MAIAALVPLARVAGQALIASAPAVSERALALISKATGGRVGTVAAAVDYARKSSNNLAVVAINGAKAGIPPTALMPPAMLIEMADASMNALNIRVRAAFASELGRVDSVSLTHSNTTEEERVLHTAIVAEVAERLSLRSRDAIVSFHAQLKLFLAMDEGVVLSVLNGARAARRLPA